MTGQAGQSDGAPPTSLEAEARPARLRIHPPYDHCFYLLFLPVKQPYHAKGSVSILDAMPVLPSAAT